MVTDPWLVNTYLLAFTKGYLSYFISTFNKSFWHSEQFKKYKCLKNTLPDSREGRKKEIMYTRQGIMPNVESFFKIS